MLEKDPFQSIDTTGVGSLVGFACEMGCEIAEEQEKAFKLGVCGEHGGDPASIGFLHTCGRGCVSCSPLRVSVAKAAMQQAIEKRGRPADLGECIVGRGALPRLKENRWGTRQVKLACRIGNQLARTRLLADLDHEELAESIDQVMEQTKAIVDEDD